MVDTSIRCVVTTPGAVSEEPEAAVELMAAEGAVGRREAAAGARFMVHEGEAIE